MSARVETSTVALAATSTDKVACCAAGYDLHLIKDSRTPGLYLRVSKKQVAVWYYRTKQHGKRRLGTYRTSIVGQIEMTHQEAQLEIAAVKVERNVQGTMKQAPAKACPTLAHVNLMYVQANPRGVGEATLSNRSGYWAHICHTVLPTKRIDIITGAQVEDLRIETRDEVARSARALLGTNDGIRTSNKVVEYVALLIDWAVSQGQAPAGMENPARSPAVHKQNDRNPRKVVLTADQRPRFMVAVEEFKRTGGERCATIADIIYTALLTGARISNVLTMRWCEISPEWVWMIPGSKTKTGEAYTIPLERSFLQPLLETRKETTWAWNGLWVFPSKNTGQPYTNIRHGWKTIIDRAGVPDLHIHDLRRTQGSVQYNLGINQKQIQEALCHSDLKSTDVYTHLGDQEVLRVNFEAAAQVIINGSREEMVVVPRELLESVLSGNPHAMMKLTRLVDCPS